MPYKQWISNERLYSADVNSYLMNQSLIVCTSGSRPASPTEGMVIYETDLDRTMFYDGSSWKVFTRMLNWTSYTPTFAGTVTSPTLGTGNVQTGRYTEIGSTVVGWAWVQFGSSGNTFGSGDYRVGVPVAADLTRSPLLVGTAVLFDASAVGYAHVAATLDSSTGMAFRYPATWPSGAATTVTPTTPWTWANSDYIHVRFMYERA